MPTILDLPPELLASCASYLPRRDLKTALLVSKHFNKTMNLELYRRIHWTFYGSNNTFHVDPIRVIGTKFGHAFAKLVQTDPVVARQVRQLTLTWESCDVCHKPESIWQIPEEVPPGCTQVNRTLLSTFENLKHLELLGDWGALYPDLPIFPSLDSLSLFVRGWGFPTHFDLPLLLKGLKHPKLRSLSMGHLDIRFIGSDDTWANNLAKMGVTSDSMPPGLTALTLENTVVDGPTLTRLFRHLPNLKTLNFIRPLTDTNDTHQNIDLRDLFRALEVIKDTVENLSLSHRSFRKRRRDHTLLGPLTTFHHLRRLIIEPAMLVGREICPKVMPSTIVPPSSFASMLPSSLEELTVVVDLEQVQRIRNYREVILQGLLQQKERFPFLSRITFLEDGFYRSDTECLCTRDQASVCPGTSGIHPDYQRMTAKEAFRFWEASKICQSMGIELKLLEDEDMPWQGYGVKDNSWVML